MAQPTRNYDAGADIPRYTIVKISADFTVVPCTSATDRSIGVTTEIDASSGERVDVYRDDFAYVVLGGTVVAGDPLTSDSNGAAVKSTPAATVTNCVVGFAETDGVAGDVIKAYIQPVYHSNAANS